MRMFIRKMEGNLCYLSPVSIEDAEQHYEWLNDLNTAIYLRTFSQIITLEQERQWLSETNQNNHYVLSIIDKKTDHLIGNCGIHEVDLVNRSGEYGIFIGDPAYRSQGFGTEATQLMLDFGFNALNLHNIWVRVYAYNQASLCLFKKCGFKIIGHRREAKIIGDQKHDEILMDLISNEYQSIYIKKLLE